MLSEEENLNFHENMTKKVADLEADNTSSLGGLSNQGCNGLSMVHSSLVDYQTLLLHSPKGLHLLEVMGTYQ
jgi:hypothetical protein